MVFVSMSMVEVAMEVTSVTTTEVAAVGSSSAGAPPASFSGVQILPETSSVLEMSAPWQAERTHGVAAATISLLLAGSQEQAMSSVEQSVSAAMASWRHGSCCVVSYRSIGVEMQCWWCEIVARTAQAGKSARVTWAEAPAAKTAATRTVEYFMVAVVWRY